VTQSSSNRTIAVILAGGQGSRAGGVDKGLHVYRQKQLIEHCIERIQPQVDQIIISANRNISQYQRYGFEVVSDDSSVSNCADRSNGLDCDNLESGSLNQETQKNRAF